MAIRGADEAVTVPVGRYAFLSVSVTLLERNPYLGGKLAGWREPASDGTPVDVEHGFHAFFRHYYNLRHRGRHVAWLLPVALAALAIAALAASLSRGTITLIDYGLVRRELYHPARRSGTCRSGCRALV